MILVDHWGKKRNEIVMICVKMRRLFMMNMTKAVINGDGRSGLFCTSYLIGRYILNLNFSSKICRLFLTLTYSYIW